MEAVQDGEEDEGRKKKKVKPGSFQGLGLSQATYKAVMRMGYKMPTPIQRKTIPTILEGQDVVAMARTGSGKTAAFIIPTVERLRHHSMSVGVRCVVLSPTRELAMQTAKFSRQLSRGTGLRTCLLVGGQAMEAQFEHLANNPDIIVAAPGRLMHHILEAELSLSRVEVLVMDEGDRLFELGFADQLNSIMAAVPISRQVLLFSATLPSQLVSFSRAGLKNPVFVRLDVETTLSDQLELQFLYVRKDEKLAAAVSVLRRLSKGGKTQTIVFVATKHHVEFFGELLTQLGMTTAVVYGTMDQVARQNEVARFRRREASILLTTDVAARGVDIPMLDHVVNFDFPPSAKLFVHRTGRTARAGRSGLAVSLVTMEDLPYTVELCLFLGTKMAVVGSPNSVDEKGKKRPMLGAVPALEYEMENLGSILSEDGTIIRSLHKSMMASYGLYNKSRPSASKTSVQRARELMEEAGGPARLQGMLHPTFLDDAAQEGRGVGSTDKSAMDFIQELRGYRPLVEKVGNVISSAASKVMARVKTDVNVAKETKAEVELLNGDAGSDDDEDDGAEGVETSATSSSAPRRGKKRPREAPRKVVEKGPRVSKRAKLKQGKDGGVADAAIAKNEFDDFDVQVDGVEVGATENADSAKSKKSEKPQFYLSVQRDIRDEAKESGLAMEDYQLDLMPDDEGKIKSSKSVVRWDAKKKKFLPCMVAADGSVNRFSRKNESGKKVKGDAEASGLYQKWAKTSKLRIQRPGELEQGGVLLGRAKKQAEAKTIAFDDAGEVKAEEKERKPVVPFHGQIEEKYLTNKQKRILQRRKKGDRVMDGSKAKNELLTPAQIQKEKKIQERKKLAQNPHKRKMKGRQAKEERMQKMEEKQMKGANTRSKMLVFDRDRKWTQGKARTTTGHGRRGNFGNQL